MTTQRKDHNQANICQYKSKQWKGPSDKSIKLNHDFNLKESNKFIEELKISNKRLTNATIRKMDKIEMKSSYSFREMPKEPKQIQKPIKIIQKQQIKDLKLANIKEKKPNDKSELLENVRKYLQETKLKEKFRSATICENSDRINEII